MHWSPRSPFVRKVMIVLHETGLLDRVECERSVVVYAGDPNEKVLKGNPLGKIPTLVLEDGTALFDSRVICEYLDTLHSGLRLFPEEGQPRFRQLRWQALGDGMTDIQILWRNEEMRPGGPYVVITSAFDRKLRASFALLEQEASELEAIPFGIGHIAIICAIGQLDFRFLKSHWREAFPALAKWHAQVSQRPSVVRTEPEDDLSPLVVNGSFDDFVSPVNFLSVGR
nr:glutathione S-transferase [Propylenella binzhouense]